MNIVAVDIFCGVGGITHGFIRSGIPVLAGYDSDKSCQYAYEINNGAKFECKSIEEVGIEEIKNIFPQNCINVIIGCAPCQPFSTYTHKYKKNNSKIKPDPRFGLLSHFTRILDGVNPAIISMENVPDLSKRNYPQYSKFLETLDKKGYYIFEKIINCAEYGVPQSRRRLVVLASLLGPIELISPTNQGNYVTVRDAISHLPPIKDGEQSSADPLHKSSRLSLLNRKRIKATPQGGGWQNWPDELLLCCHKKKSGQTYSAVYGRIKWDEVGPTITTQSYSLGTGRFGHPEQDRALSLREAALMQTFPEHYEFTPPGAVINFSSVGRHIGNAVPVKLAEIIGLSVKKHVKQVAHYS